MKRVVIAAMVLSLALALPAFAADTPAPSKPPVPSFEQKKAQILSHIEERNTKLQQEKDCVKSAKSDDDLNDCRAKFGNFKRKGSPSGMGRPGGMSPMGQPSSPGSSTPQ
jgi:hypothetical protein